MEVKTARNEFPFLTPVRTKPPRRDCNAESQYYPKPLSMARHEAQEPTARLYSPPMVLSKQVPAKDQDERPRTPYPFDNYQRLPVNMSAPKIPYKPGGSDAKRQRLPNGNFLSFASINIEPPSHDKHDRTSKRYNISPTELVTASKSIISQVNWSEVILDVVGHMQSCLDPQGQGFPHHRSREALQQV